MFNHLNRQNLKLLWIILAALLSAACSNAATLHLVLPQNSGLLTDVAFSPDGRTIAASTINRNSSLYLWDSTTGQMLFVQRSPFTNRVAFNPDGRTLATSGMEAVITFWDAQSGDRLSTLDALSIPRSDFLYNPIIYLEYSPDGRFLLTAEGKTWKPYYHDFPNSLWDVESGQLLQRWPETHPYFVFSPDGQFLAVHIYQDSVGEWIIWSLDPLEEQVTLADSGSSDYHFPYRYITYSPDSSLIAGWQENHNTIRFWEANSGKVLYDLTLDGTQTGNRNWYLRGIRFNADGTKILTGDCKNGLDAWNVADGSHIKRLQLGPKKRWNCFTPNLSPDGSRLVRSDEGVINIWDLPEEFR